MSYLVYNINTNQFITRDSNRVAASRFVDLYSTSTGTEKDDYVIIEDDTFHE